MIEFLKRLLTPPSGKDEFQEAQVSLLNGSLISVIIFIIILPPTYAIIAGGLDIESWLSALAAGILSIVSFVLMRYRKFDLASFVFIAAVYIGITTHIATTTSVLNDLFVPMYMIVLILGTLLQNQRGAISTTLLLLLTFTGLYSISPDTVGLADFIVKLLIFSLAGVLLLAAPNILSTNLRRLQKANEELRSITQQQESLVQERTRGLTLAFEVANNITRIRD
ncbi:MAG: hypothetical protein KDE51_23480, partial [Anaerolineales bacterium]|nr:hypothetical protein [Anaerolineales bacterium]